MVTRLEEELQGPGSCHEQLQAAIKALYTLYDEQPYTFRFILIIQHDLGPSIDESVRMPHDCVEAFIASFFKKLPKDELILCAGAMMGTFIVEASGRVIHGHLPLPLAQYASQVSDHCLQLLRGLANKFTTVKEI